MIKKYVPALAAILVALTGLVSLAQVLSITIHHHHYGRIDDSLLPFTVAQNSRLFIVAIGLVLLYLSAQIFRRKILAYQMVCVGLIGLIGAELFLTRNTAQLLFYIVTLVLLLLTQSEFTVANSNLSLKRGALVSSLIILVVFSYATIGFARLSAREVGTRLSVPAAMKYAAREIFTFQENQLPLRTRNARVFVTSVNVTAVIAFSLVILSLFRPLRFQYGATRYDRDEARRILEKYSDSTEDFFKLWPHDKHYFFSPEHDSFIAYKVIGSDALALEGPSGDPKSFPALMQHFAEYCHQSAWSITYINATDGLEKFTGDKQYQRLFIGNEAIIDIPAFAEQTHRSKHFRYIKNRAERDGLTFEYWPAPLTSDQLHLLRAVSDSWLGSRSRREYTFALGYFDPEYIANCDIGVVLLNGSVVAYANVVTSFVPAARTIDHMRYRATMPASGMHFLLMQLLLCLHEQNIRTFNLGLAPLSGLEDRAASNTPERLLSALKKIGSSYYSFGGLEQFKNKFEPSWQPRYIYYKGSPARLLKIATSLSRAVNVPVAGRIQRWLLTVTSIVAAFGYNSFIIAFALDPDGAFTGYASQLSAEGRADAPFYNALDILSSILIFVIIWRLWNNKGIANTRTRWILTMLGVSALGNLLAAVAPLPLDADSSTLQIALHDVYSAINVLGGAAAAMLIAISNRNRILRILFAVLVVALSISFVFDDHPVGAAAQRVQIVLTGLWFIITTAYLVRLGTSSKSSQ